LYDSKKLQCLADKLTSCMAAMADS